MSFLKRLMEIKEAQLSAEFVRTEYLRRILEELKRRKDGKNKNKRN